MKISNSKKQLAAIIHENGGWRDGANFSAQDSGKDRYPGRIGFYIGRPKVVGCRWFDGGRGMVGDAVGCIRGAEVLPNWHQTVLSRDEYFHLYPAPDADGWIEWEGGECPVDGSELVICKVRSGKEWRDGKAIKARVLRWWHTGGIADIIAYRLHKTEPKIQSEIMGIAQVGDINVVESKPTIEQLAADYHNAKDYADRKQQEADAAKADAEAKLAELVAAGKALGLVLSVVGVTTEPELVIINWQDLHVGDLIWYAGDDELSYGEYYVMGIEAPNYEGYRTVMVNGVNGGHWIDTQAKWGLIRRPT